MPDDYKDHDNDHDDLSDYDNNDIDRAKKD